MATEVLLMESVPELGNEGDIVRVANGYARNYLLPRKLAAPVNPATQRRLAKLITEREATRKRELQTAQELANRLANATCTIPMKTSGDQNLYGSVGVAEIVAVLQAQDLPINKGQIELAAPFKQLGVYPVAVRLHRDVLATVKVWIIEE